METKPTLEQYVPDKLLGSFKHSSFALALVISLGIHLVAIAGTSTGYIVDRWVDPEGAKQRKVEAQARLQAEATSNQLAKTAASATNAPAGTVSNAPPAATPATGAVASAAAPAAPATNDLARTNTVMMKQLSETAKPEEIPSTPNDLGISIKDTNPK